MNYEKIYYNIINKALRKEISGQRYKNKNNYFETHHIKPRSLGGSDNKNNLVLLTPKEHYLCHWLLVKIYDKDTIERKKMLKAWFMMAAIGNTNRPTISMRDYEKYKIEHSKYMAEINIGAKNGRYGTHWYTDLRTGKSYVFKEKPNEFYVLGKNWFNNEGKDLYYISTKSKRNYEIIRRKKLDINYIINHDITPITYFNYIRNKFSTLPKWQYEKNLNNARNRWNQYHSGNYTCLRLACKDFNVSRIALHRMFLTYIPLYQKFKLNNKRPKFISDKSLINKYE